MKRKTKYRLIKGGIGITVIATTLFVNNCGHTILDKYYIVTDKGQNYICTREDPKTNTHDYEFYNIKDDSLVGSMCSKLNCNFDYSTHRAGTKFLNELQIIPLDQALNDEKVDANLFKNEDDIKRLLTNDLLNNIVNNHFVRKKYYLTENFDYIQNSDLQMFVYNNETFIGYDISPDRELNKYRYIYSIEDMDVKEFNRDEVVEPVNIRMYLSDSDIKNKYVKYNDAIDMVISYKEDHNQKVKKIS